MDVVVAQTLSGIQLHHRPIEPVRAQARAELRRAIPESRRRVRLSRLRTEGQRVHGRLRRRRSSASPGAAAC